MTIWPAWTRPGAIRNAITDAILAQMIHECDHPVGYGAGQRIVRVAAVVRNALIRRGIAIPKRLAARVEAALYPQNTE